MFTECPLSTGITWCGGTSYRHWWTWCWWTDIVFCAAMVTRGSCCSNTIFECSAWASILEVWLEKFSPAACFMERSNKAHTWVLPWSPPGQQHRRQCPNRGFLRPGLWHSSPSLDPLKPCFAVFLLILKVLPYPSLLLSSSMLFNFVYNQESKEVDTGKLYSSSIWAMLTGTKVCVLFLCVC